MLRTHRKRIWIAAGLIVVLAACLALDSRLVTGEDAYATVGRSIDEYAETLKLLTKEYYKSLDSEELTDAAIRGMVGDLDPYTQFLDHRSLEQLQIDTQGKFGGLGITISLQGGDVPVVMSVLDNTPAQGVGLVVGDRIVKVDGDPTSGKSLEEVVEVLRGRPSDPVVVTLDRPGRPKPFDQKIVRARIGIESVQLAEEVEPGIGYISMSGMVASRFSETTPEELEKAIQKLKAQGVNGFILDLRGNPGGLLTQAVAVADKFIEPGRTVVTTKGRKADQNSEYRTAAEASVKETPLVVLVDGHSASASEIVAGAIQDSDRGLVLGTPTFGKGSVQTVRQIGRDKAIKLTTALYYTPSGRSIHKTSKRARWSGSPMLTVSETMRVPVFEVVATIGRAAGREEAVAELSERFELKPEQAEQVLETELGQLLGLGLKENSHAVEGGDPKEAFRTLGGRIVYGGGGITPDVEVEHEQRPRVVIAMARSYVFFDFAVWCAMSQSFPEHPRDLEVDDDVMAAFRIFVADSSNTRGFQYQTPGEIRLGELEEELREAGIDGEGEREALAKLREAVALEREALYEKAEPSMRLEIARQLANRVWGMKGKLLVSLQGDKQFQEAIRILGNPVLYQEKMRRALAAE
jgi:carboxyl-terminal processing protease